MKILIAYAGKSGTTQKAVQHLQRLLPDATAIDLTEGSASVDEYDTLIIGGAIRMGKLPKEVTAFMEENADNLLKKPLGLFICCGIIEEAPKTLEAVYSQELREHAVTVKCFGGEINTKNLKGMEKVLAKVLAKQMAKNPSSVVPELDVEAIEAFAKEIN